jgi:hypothetical protein
VGLFSRILAFARSPSAARALAAPAPADAPPTGPLTRRNHGLSAGDWAHAQRQAEKWFGPFNPRHVSDAVLKIMGSDWSLGFAREIWLSAFHAVDYRLEGGSPEIRAFIEALIERNLWQWVETALRSLDYGRQACELVWSLEDVAFSFAVGEGKVVTATRNGAYVLGELRDLDPELVEILADERTGDYRGLRYQGVELPGSKTLLVTNEPEFGGLLGRSLNVRAYNPWWWGNLAYLGLNRYLERKGDPPIIGFAPGAEVADDSGNSQDPVRCTAVGLANLRSGGAYVFPQEFDPDSKQPLYAVRSLEVAERAPEFLSTIDRYEHNKRLAWLIPGSLGGGASGGGSFASDKVSQQLVHRMFDRRLQRLILDPLNKHVIPKLVRFNFGAVPASAYPRLAAGSMAENAREIFAELLRSALQLEGVAPDGRAVQIAQMIDWCKGLRTLNLPKVDPALIPDPPAEPPPGRPTAGRPPRVPTEKDRSNAPSRPGLARPSIELASRPALPTSAEAYFESVDRALRAIDDEVARAERVAEDHRRLAEQSIRSVLRKAVLSARTTETSDGREAISARNRRLADDAAAEIERRLSAVLEDDLLDEGDLDGAALTLGRRSPLIEAHAAVAREAGGLLQSLGIPAPGPTQARRIVGDVLRDGSRNGRGVVIRETRRTAEALDRIVQGGMAPDAAERIAEEFTLPRREWIESTVHHVRATARATLSWSGALEEADQWLVMGGPETRARLALEAPNGEAASLLYRPLRTRELDDLSAERSRGGAFVSHWRNLGLQFFSPEVYVPIPKGDGALVAAIVALAAEKRREWNARRTRVQEAIDAKNAEADQALARRARAEEAEGAPEAPTVAARPAAPTAAPAAQALAAPPEPTPAPPPLPPPAPPPAPIQLTIVNQASPPAPAPSVTVENHVAPAEVRLVQPITVQPAAAPEVWLPEQPLALTVEVKPGESRTGAARVIRNANGDMVRVEFEEKAEES